MTSSIDAGSPFLLDAGAASPFNLFNVLHNGGVPGSGANTAHMGRLFSARAGIPQKADGSPNAGYYKVYRRLQQLEGKGLVKSIKGRIGGTQWSLSPTAFDLIRQVQNSNRCKQGYNETAKNIFAWPKKTRPERINAISICNESAMMDAEQREDIASEFQEYLDDINFRRIVMKTNTQEPLYATMEYKTRFNAWDRKVGNLEKYEEVWKNATFEYTDAVVLTLTTDPKRHKSLWHANRHFSAAFNRFMSFLVKRNGGVRPAYISAYEFTPGRGKSGKSGLLHAHIAIFGKSYLMNKKAIAYEWSRCGQGEIVDIYAIRRTAAGGWTWARGRPADAKKDNTTPDNYLKKYLKKALFSETGEGLELYWTFNKRYFSYSRKLTPAPEKKEPPTGLWVFVGSWHEDLIPDIPTLNSMGPKGPPPVGACIASGPPVKCTRNSSRWGENCKYT